jgi:8-amino-7-oxononanoate synthase
VLPEPLQQIDRTWVKWRGQTLAYFGGCDYFRMASHPFVLGMAGSSRGVTLSVAASRWTTGNHVYYSELESIVANFFKVQSAMLVSSGFLTNLAVILALADEFTHVFIDERAHPSLVQAAASVRVPVHHFRHRNPDDLSAKVRGLGSNAIPLLLTDGVFSMSGSVAPLDEYNEILPQHAWMVVDDAHGAGVVGPNGRGVAELFGLRRPKLIQTITLSKAFGSFGGVILSDLEFWNRLKANNPVLIGSTPIPLPCALAASASVQILRDNEFRTRLRENVRRVCGGDRPAPILSVQPSKREEFSKTLLSRGIFPSEIHYGGESHFRFAISSEHTRAQLDALAEALRNLDLDLAGAEAAVGFAQ